MTRSDGLPSNAVYGFCSMMMRLLPTLGADDIIAAVFDAARRNWRNDIYPEYKANRADPPDALKPQFAYIRKAVEAFDIPSVDQVGIEADDIIAAYSRQIVLAGGEVVIYSSDKDMMQLLSPRVSIYDPLKSRWITPGIVMEKFGVSPEKVVDVQALTGDASDNIPGIRGIGPKTAAELVNKYGSLEKLLDMAKNIPQAKRRAALLSGAEDARISKRLALLRADAEVEIPFSSLVRKGLDRGKLRDFLLEMEFRSLAVKAESLGMPSSGAYAPSSAPASAPPPAVAAAVDIEKRYELVQTEDRLCEWVRRAYEKKLVAIDTETTGLDALSAGIVGVSLATDAGEACYVPLGHRRKNFAGTSLFDGGDELAEGQIPVARAVEILAPLLSDASVRKIGHNIKYDLHILRRIGLELENIDDTMIMSYVLDGTKNLHNMDDLARIHLGFSTIKFDEVAGRNGAFADVDFANALAYAAEDADITLRLWRLFSHRLEAEDPRGVYADIDAPLVKVLFEMEEEGIAIDSLALINLSAELERRMGEAQVRIFKETGAPFNILSPKQLGEVLFDRMRLPNLRKYSTDANVLKTLDRDGHGIAGLVLKFRELSKLKNTYADVLPKSRAARDNRVHTSYFQAGTSTGRLSSSDPNLQNIPVKTELGGLIRRAFIAGEGRRIVSADYSQIELRILAEMADVKNLKEAFLGGVDIHARTASEIFGVPVDKVSPDLRRKAKAVNFGIIYGISPFGLAKSTGGTQSEAKSFIESYFRSFPEIRAYMERTKEFARARGFVETMFGRKCYVSGINTPMLKGYAERSAINAPIQGTNADIIKIAMRRIYDRLRADGLAGKVRMLLQVHDELVFEVDGDMVKTARELIRKEMENAVSFGVPLLAETGVADNWKDAH
jgi:DNA polymerase-1